MCAIEDASILEVGVVGGGRGKERVWVGFKSY
jgi:hypothetical protein